VDLSLNVTMRTGESWTVKTDALSIVWWERMRKTKISALADGSAGAEDLYALAYCATKRSDRSIPPFDDWLAMLDTVDPLGDDTPDPTPAEASAE
jgi:hypothetical protein